MQNSRLRRAVLPVLVAVIVLLFQASVSAASDPWSRVTGLERYTVVKITCADGRVLLGPLLSAGPGGITVRSMGQEMMIERRQVTRAAIEKDGRRWYSIPLAGIVGGAGATIGYAITDKASCSNGAETCSKARGVAAIALPAAAAVLTYRATLGKSWKVIYKAAAK